MRNPLYLFILSIFLVSCTDNLDFSQAKDYSTTKVYDFTILYFAANQSLFKDASGLDLTTAVSDETNFTIFKDHIYVKKKFLKAVLDIEITNEFNRDFKVELFFLREDGVLLHKAKEIIAAKNTSKKLFKEIISVSETPSIVNTGKIRAQITMLPSSNGALLDFSEPKKIEVKSSGKFYLKS